MHTQQAKSKSPNTAATKTAEMPQKAAVSAASASRVPAWAGGMNDQLPPALVLQDASAIPGIQAKLAIGQPNDLYEQEADRVAEQVMRMPASPATVQRKCACGGVAGPTGECEACAAKRKALQRRATQSATEGTAPPIVNQVVSSGNGQPLDAGTRAFMEPRFGTDFSQVRVHTDGRAAESARSVSALAYTVGNDVVFGKEQYQPQTSEGKRLLAHELVHTMQQQGGAPIVSEGTSTYVSRKPSNVPAIQRQTRTFSTKGRGKQAPKATDQSELSISWRGSVRNSLFEYIKHLHQSDQSATQITNDLMNSATGFQANGEKVTLEKFESVIRSSHATSFLLDEDMTNRLMQAVGLSLRQLQITSEVEKALAPLEELVEQSQRDTSPEKESEKAKQWEPVAPMQGNWRVLEGSEELALYYLDLMQHFAGMKVTAAERAMAQGGLNEEERSKLIGNNKTFQHYTNLFTQGYQELQQTHDTSLSHFKPLEERIFEQFSFGNPTAVQNQLRIGEGWPEREQVGIVHRSDNMLLYDSNGNPIVSFGGTQMRDPGYSGTPQKDSFGLNIAAIEDPAIRQILNSLRQQFGDPGRTIIRAAHVYYDNMEEVNKRVAKGLTSEVIEKFEQALPIFLGFLAGHGLSTFLMRAPNPVMVSIGLALKGLLAAAGYILNIEFAGSALQRLLEAAYHISRVRQAEGQRLTALSEHHLEEGAKPIRSMVADIALMAATIGISKLIKARDAATIECTTCSIEAKTETAEAKGEGKTEAPESEGTQGKETPEAKRSSAKALERIRILLSGFKNKYFQFENIRLILTREGMEHFLRRHHPDYWDGSVKERQTFFKRNLTVEDITGLIKQTLEANRAKIIERGGSGTYQISHTIDGILYVLGINNGHIGQFYPTE